MADTTLHVDMVLRDFLSREISKAEGSFTKSIRRMGASSEGFRGALGKLRGGFGTLSGAVAIFAGSVAADYISSLFKSTEITKELSDDIELLYKRYGILTARVKETIAVLRTRGVSDEETVSILNKISQSIAKANEGLSLERIAYEELGIATRDFVTGEARDAIDVFNEIQEKSKLRKEDENLFNLLETVGGEKLSLRIEEIITLTERLRIANQNLAIVLNSLGLNQKISGEEFRKRLDDQLVKTKNIFTVFAEEEKKQKQRDKEKKEAEDSAKKRQDDLNQALQKYSDLLEQTDIEIIEDPLRRVNKEFEIQKQKLEEVIKLYPELRGVLEALQLNLNTLQEQQFRSIAGEKGFLGPNLEISGNPQDLLKKLGQFTGAGDGKSKEQTPFEKKLDFLRDQMIRTFQEGSLEAATAIGDNLVAALDRVGQEGENLRDIMKDLVRSILRDLQHIAVQQLVLRAIVGLGGSLSGGAAGGPASVAARHGGIISGSMGKPVKLGAYAQGGIAKGPTLALFGEGPEEEAFVPLKGGAIPVRIAGSKSGMTVNIYAYDSDGFDRLLMRRKRTFNAMMQEIIASNAPTRQQIRAL